MLHRHGSLAPGYNAFLSEMRSKTQLHLHVKDALGAVYTLYFGQFERTNYPDQARINTEIASTLFPIQCS